MKNKNAPCAEIIQSSLNSWTCQSWQWDVSPEFGALIIIEQDTTTLFGIVYDIQTGSIDPTRMPMAYKKTEEQLKNDHPEIFEFLRTTFSCIAVGYKKNDIIKHTTPLSPPKIHAFCRNATETEQKQFFASSQYIQTLFAHASLVSNIDELLFTIIQNNITNKLHDKKQLLDCLNAYSFVVGNDYRRIKQFIGRIIKQ